MGNSETGKRSHKACIIGCSVILAAIIVLNILAGVFHGSIDKFVVGYRESDTGSVARETGEALAGQIQAEGTVLVKNENGVLPLSKSVKRVNVFGWDCVDWVISGSGSGQVKYTEDATDILAALSAYGVEYNTAITDMYEDFQPSREYSYHGGQENAAGSLHSFNYEFSRLYEPSVNNASYYSGRLLAGAKEFSDTAIVCIGRVSGESNDSPKVQYKRTVKGGDLETDPDRTYLEISSEEEELLEYVGENYKSVIVLINSTNVMELGFLDEIEGIDACLITATTGTYGANIIPGILYGDVSPSGRTADTYAYNLSTSPTYVNTGSGNETTNFYTLSSSSGMYPIGESHTNGSSTVKYDGVAYEDYQEGIYVGYRWYETADEEGFWDSDYASQMWGIKNGYEDVVQYPFGYGLSYTDFEWTVSYLGIPDGSEICENDEITVGVTVKNTGSVPGQDVVQLYYTPPYAERGVEKSSVNLGAFGKTTRVLEPGEEEYVELSLKVRDMAAYDCYGLSGDLLENGGYVLEAGEYDLSLRTDAHTPADGKINPGGEAKSATITYNVSKNGYYITDDVTGEYVYNRFTGDNVTDGVAIDGNSDSTADIVYLTRSDFAGSFPSEMSAPRDMANEIRKYNIYTSDLASEWAVSHESSSVTFGDLNRGGKLGDVSDDTYVLTDLGLRLGLDYNALEWDEVLDRMSYSEMTNLVCHGYTQTAAVASVGKPETLDLDGPNQIGSFVTSYGSATGYSSIVLAQTWNTELAYSMGLSMGEECAAYGISGWYGPACNIHRSPFGGRNFEYYSEDAYLSGQMCANVVAAAKCKGIYCYLKHLCLYESESGRDGMYTWLTEQALREIYIKPFEIAVKEGGATGIMTSYGRIGAVWTGGSEALLTEVLRGEWGFEGAVLTDYSDHNEYMNADQMIRAGGDLWMCGWTNSGTFRSGFDTSSNSFNGALRNSSKNIVYMWLNALATNYEYNLKVESGEIDGTISIPSVPVLNFRWYIPVLIAVDAAGIIGCGIWIGFSFKRIRHGKQA